MLSPTTRGLSFELVSFAYRKRRLLFSDLSLELGTGSTALLGPNGAGKSTLLAIGATVLQPRSGRIQLDGLSPDNMRRRKQYRRYVGWMPQTIRAIPGFTVREQVAYAGWLKGMSRGDAWRMARESLRAVQLNSLEGRTSATLSGGELRRVGLAQVLVHSPQAGLLDEPTAGLDPAQRLQFREIMSGLAEETSFLVSTHQVDDLAAVFTKVAILVEGAIVFAGKTEDFLAIGGATGNGQAEASYMTLLSHHSR